MKRRRHSLRGRIVMTIVCSVVATSLIFGLAAFGIAYTTEDRVFRDRLDEEVAYQRSAWMRTGELAAPDNPAVRIYLSGEALPRDMRQEFAENARQTEFYGSAGRHYHIQRFHADPGGQVPAVAVMEVSRDLLVRPFREQIIALLAAIGLFIAAVMAGLGWWLVNRAMKPLGRLARDVANAETAIPALNAREYPANEIGLMAEALEQAFGRIRGFVAREQAFTRDASHELRTPLAVIRSAAEVIALDRELPPHVSEPLRRIDAATSDMTLALDQLLALARENNGVPKESVALRPLVDKAVAWSHERYPGSTIAVHIEVDATAVVHVHPTSLQLVLNNLVGNCFQHVGRGRLAVKLGAGDLSICDDGPGIDTAADPFAPFTTGEASVGSGLGLDISRRLCDAAGIDLTVATGGTGRGTCFRLSLHTP